MLLMIQHRTSGIAQAAGTMVGEYDEATLKADEQASDEAASVAAMYHGG